MRRTHVTAVLVVLSLVLFASPVAASIAVHGSTTAYQETGGNWKTKGTNDIDGSGGLGTDGWLFFGDFDGVQDTNGLTFATGTQSNLPAYASIDPTTYLAGVPEYGYGVIDNPLYPGSGPATDVSGFGSTGNTGSPGDDLNIVDIVISGLPSGQTVRLGVLGGVEATADGRWDATSYTLTDGVNTATVGQHGVNNLAISPGGVNTGWVFFDVDSDGTYTLSGTKRNLGGNSRGVGIGGITFDVIPEPATAALAAIGLLGLRRRRR